MDVLAIPFEFNANNLGSFKKVEQGSDFHKAQEIAAFTLTHRGERPIFAEYGIDDPAFAEFDETEYAADFALFYNDKITLATVEIEEEGGGLVNISVSFE